MSFFRKCFGKSSSGDISEKKKPPKHCKRCPNRSSVSTDGSAGSSPPRGHLQDLPKKRIIKNRSVHLPGTSYMPVSKENPHYNMNHSRRGKALIFNFDKWDNTNIPHLEESPRHGSQKDKKDLARCLRRMDFQVEEYDNLKFKDMHDVLEEVRFEDHTDADCLVIAVMTHGERNTVYCGDGIQIPVNIVWEYFEAHNCPTLAGKPKIFIVQACRGKKYDAGTTLHTPKLKELPETYSLISDVTDSSSFSYVIPNAADIIVAFSCPLGHYSWRSPEKGSWFIQSICKVFTQHCYSMDLQMMFTTVAREVALNYESTTTNIESNNKKQVTSTSSTLIRTVQFQPKLGLTSVPVDDTCNGHTLPVNDLPQGSANLVLIPKMDKLVLEYDNTGVDAPELSIEIVTQEVPIILTNSEDAD